MSLFEQIKGSADSPVVVLFGGSPYRRDEVIRYISRIGDITVYGTLSEKEGIAKLNELDQKTDLVVIGSRYSTKQRDRITSWVTDHIPHAGVSQPGIDYPYSNDSILADIRQKLNMDEPSEQTR